MVVLDCSVAISWFMPDENKIAEEVLGKVANYGAIVPSIWQLEVANVLLSAYKKNRITMEQSFDILNELKNLQISVEAIISQSVYIEIMKLAQRFDLTSYDAAYLELACRYAIPLATFDKKLIEACEAAKVHVIYK